ncbi:hypothetical protein JCM10212_006132 [Sporobolomyces blumeae]
MHTFAIVAALLAPATVSASLMDFLDHAQHPLDALNHRPSRLARVARPARPVESVVVHVVDPASPSSSTVSTPASIAREALEYSEQGDDDDETDSPNFGAKCEYSGNAFSVCGDYFSEETQTDHGLFCSPAGICGGRGAVCGANEACGEGLACNLSVHRCVPASASLLSVANTRKSSRQKAALAMCPPEAQACPSGYGGFECVHTELEVTQCGGCLGLGGRDCSQIHNAYATSCRKSTCVVHACVSGYVPSEDGTECIDDVA